MISITYKRRELCTASAFDRFPEVRLFTEGPRQLWHEALGARRSFVGVSLHLAEAAARKRMSYLEALGQGL